MTARTKMLVVAGFALRLRICFLSSRVSVDAAGGAAATPTPLAPVSSVVFFTSATFSAGEADGNTSLTLSRSGTATDPLVAKVTQTAGSVLFSRSDLDASFNPGTGLDNSVGGTVLQPDGRLLICGDFTTFNGISRPRVARVNANGSIDTSFNPGTGASNTVTAMALQSDGRIVIGGSFTNYNLSGRNHVARLNANGSLDTTFNPGTGTNGSVRAIAVQPDGKIIIGGAFSTYNGTARLRIARLNADGALDTSFNPGTGANGNIQTILLQPDGKILIGGFFTGYNSTPRVRVARLNADGSLDSSFNPSTGPNNVVEALALQPDGKILIGGSLTADGVSRNGIARLNADGSLDTSFDPGAGANGSVRGFALLPDGRIIVVGRFTSFNGAASTNIARLNPDGSIDATFNASGTGTESNATIVTVTRLFDGKLIIGGGFTTYNGMPRLNFARLNPTARSIPLLRRVRAPTGPSSRWPSK